MASVTFDQFLPEVQPEAPGVPYPVVINAVRNACFDFCRQSLIWNEIQDAETYTAGTAEYQVSPPTGAQVVQVLNIVLDNGRHLQPASIDETMIVRPRWQTQQGVIEWYVQTAPDTFRFVAVPDTAGNFSAQVAYAPTRAATSVDASIYNLYLESIKYGALWKIKVMAGTAWGDPAGAQYYEGEFRKAIGRAITDRTRSNSRASIRVQPVWFA